MSSADSNGSYVPRAELLAHIKGIDEHFDQLEADVVEIKWGIKGIVEELRKQRDQRADDRDQVATDKKVAWRAWGPAIAAAVVAAAVSGAFSIIAYVVFS